MDIFFEKKYKRMWKASSYMRFQCVLRVEMGMMISFYILYTHVPP